MSEEYKVVLPKLGESIVSATIVQWFKKEGDPIALDEPLLEVSTDKVNSEIPSPVAGVVDKILASVDQELQVGEVLAVIRKKGEMGSSALQEEQAPVAQTQMAAKAAGEENSFLSPAVLRAAAEKGISLQTLETMKGSGAGGRITKQDIEQYTPKTCPKAMAKPSVQPAVGFDVERVKMSGMRKAIAENMVKSFYEAPHATLIQEIDVTAVMKYVQKHRQEFLEQHGAKLTVTSFVFKALTKALAEYPLLNSSLEEDMILVKKNVHIGLAVSIEQGLIVPVVKHCEQLALPQVAKAIQLLSEKARQSKLSPDDVGEGTITVTNFGMSGVAIGVPIIRYPEVAIVGIGAIKKKLQVLEDDVLAIRSMMFMSLTFDHRVIDGMYGCGFLSALQRHLESDFAQEVS